MIVVNNRSYTPQKRPVVGICLDAAAEVMPNLQRIQEQGHHGLVQTVIPSYTNPNNMAVVTGTSPDVNGISGNFNYDATTD